MSSTWWEPTVTLSVLGATVNYLLTPWTQQSSWAHCNLGFLSVCVTEVFAKQGREQKSLCSWSEEMCLCNSMCVTVRVNSSSSLSPPCSDCLWNPYQMYPFVCWQEKLSTLTAVSFCSSKSDLIDGIKNWIRWWGGARWCLCLPESLLLAESSHHFDLCRCRHFSFSLCLLGLSRTAAFLFSSLSTHQQWELEILSSVGGSLGGPVA